MESMVPILANVHSAALAYAEDTREMLLLAPARSLAVSWLPQLRSAELFPVQVRRKLPQEWESQGALNPLFLHRDVFMRDRVLHRSLKVPCCRGWGLTDFPHAASLSPFHGAASLHNCGFFASLRATKRSQPVMSFGHANWGKAFPQPLRRAAWKGRRICSDVSWTRT